MPQISIIVPVYGAEKYLYRCLDSIKAQTFTNWECILVDDGSKDRSGAICDEHAQKDSRFRVFHKENGGVSSARNRGIEESKGQYICFIDSDDWVEPTYLQNFMEVHPERYGLVIQSFFYDYEDTNEVKLQVLPNIELQNASELEYILENTEGVHNGFLWHRLFHLDTIRKYAIRYPENVSFAEDCVFFLDYLSYVQNFIIVSKPGYHYFCRKNSLTSQGKKLPKEHYFFLLNSIAESTSKIIQKDCDSNCVNNGLRKYLWRLSYEWLLVRGVNSYDNYKVIRKFYTPFSHKYKIDGNLDSIRLYDKIMMSCMQGSCPYIRYLYIKYTIRVVLSLRKLKSILI